MNSFSSPFVAQVPIFQSARSRSGCLRRGVQDQFHLEAPTLHQAKLLLGFLLRLDVGKPPCRWSKSHQAKQDNQHRDLCTRRGHSKTSWTRPNSSTTSQTQYSHKTVPPPNQGSSRFSLVSLAFDPLTPSSGCTPHHRTAPTPTGQNHTARHNRERGNHTSLCNRTRTANEWHWHGRLCYANKEEGCRWKILVDNLYTKGNRHAKNQQQPA